MNVIDKTYLDLLKDILENGVEKDTRAGRVKSVFGRQLRFDLKKGLPLLTTKKVFTKGVIHELLWFLKHPMNSHGSMNIEYLVRNGVHIWDDDAYRWFKTETVKHFSKTPSKNAFYVCTNVDDDNPYKKPNLELWSENEKRREDVEWLKNITKEEFLELTLQRVEIHGSWMRIYRFGDLGPIYGKQWRSFGKSGADQIQDIIKTLKTNPNDRRMLCVAFNPDQLDEMALPPCHVMFQFYTRELSHKERMKIFNERYMNGQIPQKYHDWFKEYSRNTPENMDVTMPSDGSDFDIAEIPKYGLSCMFNMRSQDYILGNPFNILSYALLTHMIANIVGMIPDELVCTIGDCHVYLNQMEGIEELLKREGSDKTPQLKIKRKVENIDDYTFDDFEIINYEPNPPIKFPLSVG